MNKTLRQFSLYLARMWNNNKINLHEVSIINKWIQKFEEEQENQ